MNQNDAEVSVDVSSLKGALLTFVFAVVQSNGQLEFDKDLEYFEANDTGVYFEPWRKNVDTVGMSSELFHEEPETYAQFTGDTEGALRKYIEVNYGSTIITLPVAAVDKFREPVKAGLKI